MAIKLACPDGLLALVVDGKSAPLAQISDRGCEEMEWFTETQGSVIIGRSAKTLQRWRRSGQLAAYPQGPGRLMYRRADLESVASLQLRGRPRTTS